LPEESGLAHDDAPPGVYFAAGKVAAGWSLRIGDAGGAVEVVRTLPVDTRGLAVTAADHLAQEDARRLRWDGSVPARAWLQSDAPIDLSREAMSGAMLVVTMRLDRVPAAGFALRLSCGADCGGNVAIDTSIAPLPRGTWFTVGVPLQCFKTAGTDLARVERIFGVESSADAELTFSSVVLGDKADVRIGCTTP
jgi:beta-glucosidase